MSADDDHDGEKPHDPTEKKLADARRRGEFPRSADLNVAAAYGGLLIAALVAGGWSLGTAAAALAGMLARADALGRTLFDGPAAPVVAGLLGATLTPLLPWFLLPAAAVLASLLVQRAIVVAPQKLRPQLARISPLAAARQKFGRAGLFEFAKSLFKLAIFSGILATFLTSRMAEILLSARLTPAQATVTLLRLATGFLALVALISLVFGALDALFQRSEHLRKMRMSRKELLEEARQTEGDPQMRSIRRQRAREIATRSMLAEVPKADVVIVNPEHYAVALKWSRAPGSAPVCVAKGVDAIAARIRERALEARVPIYRDPPTARALYATLELGEEIAPEHYRAVAAAIRFADRMREAARRRWT